MPITVIDARRIKCIEITAVAAVYFKTAFPRRFKNIATITNAKEAAGAANLLVSR